MKYSVIDIEGTGGKISRSRIMEIAIYVYDDESGQIIDEFSTLVNPGKHPDRYVQKMTGITPKMLKRAPQFPEVAKRIVEMTEDTIFTAHNADYDYAMLQNEFKRLGYHFQRPVLDTINLSRELLPGIQPLGLDNLIKTLKIPSHDRHRAFGDALATVELLKILLQKDPGRKIINRYILYDKPANGKSKIKEIKMLQRIPNKPGLLKFFNNKNQLMYVTFHSDMRFKAEKLLAGNSEKNRLLQKTTLRIEAEIIPSKVIGKIKNYLIRKENNPLFTPWQPLKEKIELPEKNLLLVESMPGEEQQGIVLIEKGKLIGYAFTRLNWQRENPKALKKRLTFLYDCPYGRKIVARYLKTNLLNPIELTDEKISGSD